MEATADWVRGRDPRVQRVALEALVPTWGGGRPREITDEMRARIVEVVKSHRQELGEPYADWSLSPPRAYRLKTRVVRRISKERRGSPHRGGTHHPVHQGLEDLPRPRLRRQGGSPPAALQAAERGRLGGVLVCFDEHGPVTPHPQGGTGLVRAGAAETDPGQLPKPHGVAFFFGVYDVGADQLFGRWFARKGADNMIAMLRLVRSPLPRPARLVGPRTTSPRTGLRRCGPWRSSSC